VAQKEAVAAIQKQQAEENKPTESRKIIRELLTESWPLLNGIQSRSAVSEEEASLSSRNSKSKNSQVQSEADT
jgi:hypothetical protein